MTLEKVWNTFVDVASMAGVIAMVSMPWVARAENKAKRFTLIFTIGMALYILWLIIKNN